MKTAKRYGVVVLMLMNLTGVIAVTGVAAGPPAGAGGPPQLEQQILQAVRNLQQSVNQISTDSRRSYYLTTGAFMGDEILSPPAATPACASGYHFASFWELFDTSNLKYNTALGQTRDDSGSGPPSEVQGWIRTGFSSESLFTSKAGQANCGVWRTNFHLAIGTSVGLNAHWDVQSFDSAGGTSSVFNPLSSPWQPMINGCNLPLGAWCVQD